MTPEALSEYLLVHRCDPDVVQTVMVDYLTWPAPIRHPKAWAWRRVHWKMVDEYRRKTLYGATQPLGPKEIDTLVSTAPNPLTQAEQRQRLTRFAEAMAKDSPWWSLWKQRGV